MKMNSFTLKSEDTDLKFKPNITDKQIELEIDVWYGTAFSNNKRVDCYYGNIELSISEVKFLRDKFNEFLNQVNKVQK